MEKEDFKKYKETKGKNKAKTITQNQVYLQWKDIILKQLKKNGKTFGIKIKLSNPASIKIKKNFIAQKCFPIHLERYTWDM